VEAGSSAAEGAVKTTTGAVETAGTGVRQGADKAVETVKPGGN
jgi:hypothetical protein